MKWSLTFSSWLTIPLLVQAALAQIAPDRQDKALYKEYPDTCKQALRQRVDPTSRPATSGKPVLMTDPAGIDAPGSPDEFKSAWHRPPVCQELTGQCWAFATTSFLESEVRRLTGREMGFSVAHTFYWEFVEKAREYVRTRGQSAFSKGSEPDAVIRIWRQHGAVPADAYRGLIAGRDILQDSQVFGEMVAYIEKMKANGQWNEEQTVAAIRRILDKHLGPPPDTVTHNGAQMTPSAYAKEAVGLDLDNYVSLMSFMEQPYDAWCELKIPDNWWHSRRYFNVRLDDFAKVIREATKKGYTASLAFDNNEPGYCFREGFAIVPTFDIPPALIDDAARQMRFTNASTTDEHSVHLVGGQERSGRLWYLIKDSGTRGWVSSHKGYMFHREDYIRLKTLLALLPREAIEKALGRPIGEAPMDK